MTKSVVDRRAVEGVNGETVARLRAPPCADAPTERIVSKLKAAIVMYVLLIASILLLLKWPLPVSYIALEYGR